MSATRLAWNGQRAVSRLCRCNRQAHSMQGVKGYSVPSLRDSALQILEFSAPFCLGETCHYFKHCDSFHSFHAVIEVQFGGLACLDRVANNYKDNLNSLYRHPDLTLTIDKALRNLLVSAYSHYIDSWPIAQSSCIAYCNLPCIMAGIGATNGT